MIVPKAFGRSNSQPECEARADVPHLSDIWLDSIANQKKPPVR